MSKSWQLPRRTFLRGLGTAIALPMLEAMMPASKALAAAAGVGASGAPLRMGFVYIPNGVNMEDWSPRVVGSNYDFPMILQPLKPYKEDIQVVSGLAHAKARANGDGGGDHARANATFLTGRQARKTAGADIRAGISVDQVAAQQIGRQTKLSSLELSCDRGRSAGACDSGYSCIYQYNIAWKSDTTPMPPEVDPRIVFDRMFSAGSKVEAKEVKSRRDMYQKSILDFVMEDANSLKKQLGKTDQRKLDEYMTSVRETEIQIEQAEKFAAKSQSATIKLVR
ncbi:MAG TPA: DUF1552 domain-containing protein, partial [Roseimicrobium sp.]|nr:DUF1552 domain-containing protein [Roseimicrobium sp.]